MRGSCGIQGRDEVLWTGMTALEMVRCGWGVAIPQTEPSGPWWIRLERKQIHWHHLNYEEDRVATLGDGEVRGEAGFGGALAPCFSRVES